MSSNLEDVQSGSVRYYGMQLGFVSSVEDPQGVHRIKVNADPICEETDWLYPMIMGGGSANRGGHAVPVVGATVAFWWHNGDPAGQGVYVPVAWSLPDGADPEIPYDARNAGGDAHLVQTMRLGRIIMTVDERPGKEAFKVYDAEGGFSFQVDLKRKIVGIEGLTGLQLRSKGQLLIDALQVVINNRLVAVTSDHI